MSRTAKVDTVQHDQPEPAAPNARPWSMLAVVILGFVGLGLLTTLLPHDPYVRYQQLSQTLHFRSIWGYERIVYDDTPIDVAIIGNSRLQSAVSAPVLQAQLSEQLGRPVRVANLSLPQEGRNAHYSVARNLFEHHPEVQLVLLSAIEAMPRDGHPAFRSIAEAGDVITAPALVNRSYPDDLAFVPFRQISLFVQSMFPEAFGVKAFSADDYYGTDYDTTLSYESPTGGSVDKDSVYSAELLRPFAQERVASITSPVLPEALVSREFAIEHYYTQRIADMARGQGAEVMFLYMPIFENPEALREEPFYRDMGDVLTAECFASEAGLFSDYGHLNTVGAHQLSRMLGDTLARLEWAEHSPSDSADGQSQGDRISLCN